MQQESERKVSGPNLRQVVLPNDKGRTGPDRGTKTTHDTGEPQGKRLTIKNINKVTNYHSF